jgi:hypothetical protein
MQDYTPAEFGRPFQSLDDNKYFESYIKSLKEFAIFRDTIDEWKKTDTGINSNEAFRIVDAVIDLCVTVKTRVKSELKIRDENFISCNYSTPIQTGLNQWSVFVRKYSDDQVIAVMQHKFHTQSAADEFSKNNWNLGEYF